MLEECGKVIVDICRYRVMEDVSGSVHKEI